MSCCFPSMFGWNVADLSNGGTGLIVFCIAPCRRLCSCIDLLFIRIAKSSIVASDALGLVVESNMIDACLEADDGGCASNAISSLMIVACMIPFA